MQTLRSYIRSHFLIPRTLSGEEKNIHRLQMSESSLFVCISSFFGSLNQTFILLNQNFLCTIKVASIMICPNLQLVLDNTKYIIFMTKILSLGTLQIGTLSIYYAPGDVFPCFKRHELYNR